MRGKMTLAVLVAFILAVPSLAAAKAPVKHRIMLIEYGKGPNRLLEVSAEGNVLWEHKFPSISVIFEVLPGGNVIYAYGGNPTGVQEVNRDHKVVWNYTSKCPQVLGCRRLANGNTLVACGTQKRVIEVTPAKRVVWELTAKDVPDLNLTWMTNIQILKNGHYVIGNFLRGQEGKGAHAFEITRAKKVIWKYADHKLIKSLTTVYVRDDK